MELLGWCQPKPAGFRVGFGRGPDLELELKFVKPRVAHVLGFCFQMHSEVRKGKALD